MKTLIQTLPKAELHLHIEGTLEPELLFSLANKNKVTLPYPSIEALRETYQFTDLQSFLNIYYAGLKVLIEEEDFYELTLAYLKRAKAQNILHTEIFFDPQSHISRGIPLKTVINGISKALEYGRTHFHISSHLIMCFLRDMSEQSAEDTLAEALPFKDKIIGIGLDSAEKQNPPSKFQAVYEKARQQGYLAVAHAGEEGPPEYIWEALDLLKVKRIDHGICCMEDERLVKRLSDEQIPLTVCPISNLKLKVVTEMSQHPLKRMLDKKLCVTVNSDDPAYFGGYLNKNYLAIQEALKLSREDILKLVINSFNASFLTTEEKQAYLERVKAAYS